MQTGVNAQRKFSQQRGIGALRAVQNFCIPALIAQITIEQASASINDIVNVGEYDEDGGFIMGKEYDDEAGFDFSSVFDYYNVGDVESDVGGDDDDSGDESDSDTDSDDDSSDDSSDDGDSDSSDEGNVVEQCSMVSIADPGQNSVPDWDFSTPLDVAFVPFLTNPDVCEVLYTCDTTSGPTGFTELCVAGNFDPIALTLSITSTDKSVYIPGDYNVRLTATSTDNQGQNLFADVPITIVDPCPTATITLASDPFSAGNPYEYILRDPDLELTWSETGLVTKDTAVDCGTLTYVFLNEDDTAFDTAVFEDNRSGSPSNIFKVPQNDDPNIARTYSLKLKALFADAPLNSVESSVFDITIVDPCLNPVISVTEPTNIANQEYTITDTELSYTLTPNFSVVPAFCTTMLTVSNPGLESALMFDQATQTFTLVITDSLVLSGDTETAYPVTASFKAGNINQFVETRTVNFDIVVKNPCIDSNFVTLTDPGQPDNISDNYSGSPFTFTYNPFTVNIALCTISVTCEDAQTTTATSIPCQELDGDNQLTFQFDTDDYLAGDPLPGLYSFQFLVKTGPGDGIESSFLFFLNMFDPCDPPISLTEEASPDVHYTITDDDYPDYTHPQFVIDPDYCPYSFSYTIMDVSGTSAVSRDNDTFSFFYNTDLSLLGESQTITISAESFSNYGTNNATKTASDRFDVVFKNPCIDTDYVNIIKTAELSDEEYIVYDTAEEITLTAWTIDAQPGDHNLCGNIEYTALYEDDTLAAEIEIDDMSSPLAWFADMTEWTLFSEEAALINTTATYTLQAQLEDWPTSTAGNRAASFIESEAMITYNDPCLAPFGITASPTAVNLGLYSYDGSVLTHDNSPMTVNPDICTVTYSCAQVSGPSVLDCATAGITTFDTVTGDFTFSATTAEFSTYAPGTYVVRVTGTTGIVPQGQITATVDITFELEDLCVGVSISLNDSPFQLMEQAIGDAAETQPFTVADLFSLDLAIDCGRAIVNFYDNDSTEVLKSVLFEGQRPDDTTGVFVVKQQSNASLAGLYDIFYTVFLENYPTVSAKYSTFSGGEEAFKVRLVDLDTDCDGVTGVTQIYSQLCPTPSDDNSDEGKQVQWLKNLEDQSISNTDPNPTTIILNGGVCESNGNQATTCEVLPLNDAADFFSYDGPTNTVTIDPTQIEPEDEGFWLITFKVTRTVGGGNQQEFFKSFVLTVTYVYP